MRSDVLCNKRSVSCFLSKISSCEDGSGEPSHMLVAVLDSVEFEDPTTEVTLSRKLGCSE